MRDSVLKLPPSCRCSNLLQSPLQLRTPRNSHQVTHARSRTLRLCTKMVVATAPEIKVTKKDAVDQVKRVTPFNLDDYVAGKSPKWTQWDCDPSTFPWEYDSVEYAYVIAGQFFVTYEGGDAVEINAGDFVRFPVGKTTFKVTKPVRKFFICGLE
ncbi:hypothetical protein WJX73_007591 [Symbiochloris irregularis]|uniref:(S)-ureidoglycine aminohydrolase cupin domain-containing protein n=1 Tax=Symbiochloris irregularis TaxID=706552 RepID=A0AAW1P6B2_9CHLO